MARRKTQIPQKRMVFLAGEGLSERGYGLWLNKLAGKHEIPVVFRAEGHAGGDPLELIEWALKKLAAVERTGKRYRLRCLLLDTDQFGRNENRDRQAIDAARRHRLLLIRQTPDHEGFLAHHFKGLTRRKPSDSKASLKLLKTVWPDYKKGMDAIGYEKKLTLEHLERARSVEAALDEFLIKAGWKRQ